MQLKTQPTPRAPYTVIVNGVFRCTQPTAAALYHALRGVEQEERDARTQHEAKQAQAHLYYDGWVEEFNKWNIEVIDNRGQLRKDIRSAWQLLWHFSEDREVSSIEDTSWDGDFRPRGRPIPYTGQRWPARMAGRKPRVWGARKYAHIIANEGEPKVRASRNSHALYDVRDRYYRYVGEDKNWKHYRKSQYRMK